MCGCEIFIQDGTYQESINNWHKQLLKFIKNRGKSSMRGYDEHLDADNIDSRYI